MQQNAGNETIVSLANILKGHQVSEEVIVKALALICNGFSFDCGFIYEFDFSDHYCLMEHYGLDLASVEKRYPIELLSQQDQIGIAQKSMISIERDTLNTHLEVHLLDTFLAESLVVFPTVDENQDLYGFIILLNRTHKCSLQNICLDLLSVALSLLNRYTEVRMYQNKLARTKSTLENILDHAGVDIYVNDFYTHDILYTNASMAEPYGGKEQFEGKKCWQVLFPGQKGPCSFCPQENLVDENGIPTQVYPWDYQRAFDGSWFRVFSAAFHWVDGRLAHVVSSADITQNKRNEALIENLAHYDQLTKLPNRRSLIKDCERRISQATDKEHGYLLFFDIDGFKSINDTYGHDAGDEFLIQLGAFFSEIPLLKNGIYRNGGDEFVAIMGGETLTKEHVRHLSNFIHQRFKKVWKLTNGEVLCNISIGVACYPEDGITPEELLQKADKAMYHVKKCGGGGLFFGYQFSNEDSSL